MVIMKLLNNHIIVSTFFSSMELNCFLSDTICETDLFHHTNFGSNETGCFADHCHDDFCAKTYPAMHSVSSYSSIALPDFCHENCGQFLNNSLARQENNSPVSENTVPPIALYEYDMSANDVELNYHFLMMKL